MFKQKDVKNIADLSRIAIEENQYEEMTQKFNDMIQFVDKIKSADVSTIEKESQQKKENVVRKDEIKKGIEIENIEKLSPKFSSGHIVVPAVID